VPGHEDTTGCAYCHNINNMADDSHYTKIVARRMIQMVEHINSQWQSHVQGVGVVCYTCHRGMPVPANVWYADPGRSHFNGMVQSYSSMGLANPTVGYSSLPSDVFTPFLQESDNIRVESTQALPGADYSSIKQTEWTYGLMIHFSSSLGVNCTYCHNSRQFASWAESAPQRAVAWYGIRMVRNANNEYLASLHSVFPPYRLGPTGDVAKVNCATCHQGVFKPLYGVSMLKDYPELGAPTDGTKSSELAPAPAALGGSTLAAAAP
jgi:photosynthetic reaction center cytochrome c subunit